MRLLILPVLLLAGSSARAGTSTTATTATTTIATVEQIHWVRLHDRRVFALIGGAGLAATAAARSREAGQALERASREKEESVRIDAEGGSLVVVAGETPIVRLYEDDARAAKASSLTNFADGIADAVETALEAEQDRIEISTTVFSLSLLVLTGLIAFLVMKKTTELVVRGREWIAKNPTKVPSLRLGGIEVLRPAALRGVVLASTEVGRRLVQVGVLYLWLLVALSLFESTRVHTERLTNLVLTPLSALVGRIVAALPLAVVAAIAALVVFVLVRFAGLFFGSVARGETAIRWLPADLAEATGIVVRFGIVVGAILFVAPVITGADEIQSRAAIAIFVALGLASVPVLASATAGLLVVYGRRLRRYDWVDIGGLVGRVIETTLFEVKLEDVNGREVRIPHLFALLRPQRILGGAPHVTIQVSIDPKVSHEDVREILLQATRALSDGGRVELVSLSIDGATYDVSVPATSADVRASLCASVAGSLAAKAIPLGRME